MNLLDKFKTYLQDSQVGDVTIKNYISDNRKFITWCENKFGRSFNPDQITHEIAEEYFHNFTQSDTSVRSTKRYKSSLRKFFAYLLSKQQVRFNVFNISGDTTHQSNNWHLKSFSNYLYTSNSSAHTIKNYIADVRQFLNWATQLEMPGISDQEASKPENQALVLQKINPELIEEYKRRLLEEANFSPLSVNRKLSSLRKYLSFATEKKLIKEDLDISRLFSELRIRDDSKASENLEPNPFDLNNLEARDTLDTLDTRDTPTYHSFAPIRLGQKIKKAITLASDLLVIASIVKIIEAMKYKLWIATGKEVFAPLPEVIKSITGAGDAVQSASAMSSSAFDQFITKGHLASHAPGTIKSIPKSAYAPLKISTDALPLWKKVMHTLRYSRPAWYKKYHSFPAVHYLHFAVLLVVALVFGLTIYRSLGTPRQPKSVLALHTSPQRTIAFHGSLHDQFDTPITRESLVRFAIYKSRTASGSALLWQEIRRVNPDGAGNFSSLLGQKTPLSQDVFNDNPNLYIGISVGNSAELTPRQELPNTGLAKDSDALQGLKPITVNNDEPANSILALDSSGNLTIGGNSPTTFQAIGGDFKLSGQTLTLSTNQGSNGNILLNPDGIGVIDVQKPLQNTSNDNNNELALGAVQIDDNLSIVATSSAQSALVINQNGTGDLLSTQANGIAKFSVNSHGSASFAGDLNLEGNNFTTSNSTFNLANTNAINLNIGGAATTISLGAKSGTTTINNNLKVAGSLTLPGLKLGAIPFVDNENKLTQDNSNLYWDQANKRLGLGTSTPHYRVSAIDNLSAPGTAAAAITNNNTTDSPNTVTLRLNTGASTTSQARFITFYAGVNSGDTGGTAVGHIGVNGFANTGADFAEYFTSHDSNLSQGDLVGIDAEGKAVKATTDTPLIGILSTTAGFTGNDTSDQDGNLNKVLVGLVGQLPVKVSAENGPIKAGDPLTSSSIPGIAIKSTKPGQIIGRALEAYDPAINTSNKIKIALNVSWFDPRAILLNTGTLATAYETIGSNSNARDTRLPAEALAKSGDTLDTLNKAVISIQEFVTTLKSGVLEAQQISTNSLQIATEDVMIGGQTLKSYITGIVNEIVDKRFAEEGKKIAIVSPVAEASATNEVSKEPNETQGTKEAIPAVSSAPSDTSSSSANITNITNVYNTISTPSAQTASNSATPTPSVEPSPTATPEASASPSASPTQSPDVSKEGNVSNVSKGEAPSDTFGTSKSFDTSKFANVATFSAELSYIPNLKSDYASFNDGLIVLGPTSLTDTSINGQLSIGRNMSLSENSINTLGSDLNIQPLRQGNLSIMGGLVTIDTEGNLNVSGNATFAKDVSIRGSLEANIIKPVPDSDLVIQLRGSAFIVADATGSAKFSVNDAGDVTASGDSTFMGISAKSLRLIRGAQADTSFTQTVASGSAGTAVITARETERTIVTPFVKADSLIYITPVSGTSGVTPYIARQTMEDPKTGSKGSFTIQIPTSQAFDIKLNWIIVN